MIKQCAGFERNFECEDKKNLKKCHNKKNHCPNEHPEPEQTSPFQREHNKSSYQICDHLVRSVTA
jgi:hypothetical protein